MNIVILDGQTTNPGDLSWAPLEALGTVSVYDHSLPEEVVPRAIDADAVLLCRVPFGSDIIRQLPKLKYIGTLATGFNTIDLAAATAQGITVCNVPNYCTQSVSQHVFALLLALCSHVHPLAATVQAGAWSHGVVCNQTTLPTTLLAGKRLGILGYGGIGKAVASIGTAFGMEISIYSRSKKETPPAYQWVTLQQLFSESDVLSIHCPLTPETHQLIDAALLRQMKPTALLINTARGAVLNEQDLADALNSGVIRGAGLDVLTDEPPQADHPLLQAKNCLITPHISWAAKESRAKLIQKNADNLRAFLSGHPQNCVNQG